MYFILKLYSSRHYIYFIFIFYIHIYILPDTLIFNHSNSFNELKTFNFINNCNFCHLILFSQWPYSIWAYVIWIPDEDGRNEIMER